MNHIKYPLCGAGYVGERSYVGAEYPEKCGGVLRKATTFHCVAHLQPGVLVFNDFK